MFTITVPLYTSCLTNNVFMVPFCWLPLLHFFYHQTHFLFLPKLYEHDISWLWLLVSPMLNRHTYLEHAKSINPLHQSDRMSQAREWLWWPWQETGTRVCFHSTIGKETTNSHYCFGPHDLLWLLSMQRQAAEKQACLFFNHCSAA